MQQTVQAHDGVRPMLYIFGDCELDAARCELRRTRAHVPDGARLLLADFWTDATHTQPPFAALMAGEFLVITGEGDVYSEEKARDWLQASGWRTVARQPLAGPVSLLVAETAE